MDVHRRPTIEHFSSAGRVETLERQTAALSLKGAGDMERQPGCSVPNDAHPSDWHTANGWFGPARVIRKELFSTQSPNNSVWVCFV
jgi:hypothetical protein